MEFKGDYSGRLGGSTGYKFWQDRNDGTEPEGGALGACNVGFDRTLGGGGEEERSEGFPCNVWGGKGREPKNLYRKDSITKVFLRVETVTRKTSQSFR